ncbi:MAG: SUMF1/EgtB/PvdO family nonheme iron enzyme [Terrimicrobiaceae bacterium]|nr:SUMF1/EgtB/PvdO family nonheme iron enzyme [Terrimicrobiaceae bacterium]
MLTAKERFGVFYSFVPRLTAILHLLDLADRGPVFAEHNLRDENLPTLTDENLVALGFEDAWDRRRLLAAFAPATPPGPARQVAKGEAGERPFINSLGLPLASVPPAGAFFGIWQTRVWEYAVFCAETGTAVPGADFPQGDDHPVVNVSWNDAVAFTKWLTKRERALGLIRSSLEYRLPRDFEWSAAVGLTGEPGSSPAERSGRLRVYPWGGEFPPPKGAGNYHTWLACDDFPETSPVGSFAPNEFALCDMGGNVWEWCYDEHQRNSAQRVVRGASCFNDDPEFLLSSYRGKHPAATKKNNVGFRIVLTHAEERDPWQGPTG